MKRSRAGLLLFLPFLLGATFSSSGGVVQTQPADAAAPSSYCASTNGTVNTGTTAGTITSILYLWHPASVTQRYKIRYGEIHGSVGSGTGTYLMRVTSITAENATPGGTLQTVLPLVATNPVSAAVVRSGANAPTRTAADYFVDTHTITNPVSQRFDAIVGFQPITLLGGVAAGIELRTQVVTTVTGGADIAAWVCWSED